MKRDMDLIRKILLVLEEHEHGHAPRQFEIEGFSEEVLRYHVWLMGQADLLEVVAATNLGSKSPGAIPISLTWHGHEFLEAAREPSRWQAALQKVKSAGAGMTIEIVKEVLVAMSKSALGLSGE